MDMSKQEQAELVAAVDTIVRRLNILERIEKARAAKLADLFESLIELHDTGQHTELYNHMAEMRDYYKARAEEPSNG